MMITPAHENLVGEIVTDMRACVGTVKRGAAPEGTAAMYGMLGTLPDRGMVRDIVMQVLDT